MPGLNILPSSYFGYDIDDKVEMLVVTFNDLYQRTKKELQGLFTKAEAMGIIQAFCGTMISECNKDNLLKNVKSSIVYEAIDTFFSFDGSALINKLAKLTEFQCLTVIGMVCEFTKASNGNIVPNEIVNKIFMIE